MPTTQRGQITPVQLKALQWMQEYGGGTLDIHLGSKTVKLMATKGGTRYIQGSSDFLSGLLRNQLICDGPDDKCMLTAKARSILAEPCGDKAMLQFYLATVAESLLDTVTFFKKRKRLLAGCPLDERTPLEAARLLGYTGDWEPGPVLDWLRGFSFEVLKKPSRQERS